MRKNYFFTFFIGVLFVFQVGHSQTATSVTQAGGTWIPLMKGDKFDPNDDQQSNADQDFVGNANYALVETQKKTTSFSDGITDDVYYFRVRMAQTNPLTSFYLGIDVSGDLIADLFVEANWKSQTPYVAFHKRDYTKTGLSPSQTSWLNGDKNDEVHLTSRNAGIFNYAAGTDLDGAGPDSWLEFGFTEESIKNYVLNVFGLAINGDSAIALYGFTSTSQTSNGDVGGVNDLEPGVLDKTWVELGVVINGTLNNITSGEILRPTVHPLSTEETNYTLTGTWGGDMLGDDSLTVSVGGVTYSKSNGLVISGTSWSLTIENSVLTEGTYEVVATTTRASNGQTKSDATSLELEILPPPVETTTVTSANDGGLESNGDLANLIAIRNFNRIKKNSQLNKKEKQSKFSKSLLQSKTNGSDIVLSTLFPESALTGTETSHISTADDLLNITNAVQIFGVDYYENGSDNRVAAVLATETTAKVYDHSKVICDRLNSSSLMDATVTLIDGHQVVMLQIKRDSGLIEYAVNFSVELLDTAYKIHSFWNIDQYPAGDYMNFQVWGNTMEQVKFIAEKIISNIVASTTVPLVSDAITDENRVPSVFVKTGAYKEGKLYLTIRNKTNDTNFFFEGNKRDTEVSSAVNVSANVGLTGSEEQQIVLATGNIFDIGMSIKGENSVLADALYLADGPWGYESSDANELVFNVVQRPVDLTADKYEVERSSSLSGNVKGVVNLFRNIVGGNLAFEADPYGVLEFTSLNNFPIEVVLVTKDLTDWNNRLRYQMQPNETQTDYVIPFKEFKNGDNESERITKLVGVVFSVIGDGNEFKPFNLEVGSLALLKDGDQDGVVDALDNCSNTPYGMDINSMGCFTLPTDNFDVAAFGETCPDMANGQLVISANKDYTYETSFNGMKYNFSSGEDLVIQDLAPGVYNFCITVQGDFDNHERVNNCYSVEIVDGSILSAKASVTAGKISVNIEEGTAPYNVYVNGINVLKTLSTSFSVNVNAGDQVEVKSDVMCEGVFSKLIETGELFTAYPNPTTGNFKILMPAVQREVVVELYNIYGQLISKQNYSSVYGSVQLNLENKPRGVYMAKLNLEEPVVLKIIKQ